METFKNMLEFAEIYPMTVSYRHFSFNIYLRS